MSGKPYNKERRIFIDTNVLVGCYRGQKNDVFAMDYLFRLKDYELYTSVLAIAQTISFCQGRKMSKQPKDEIIRFVRSVTRKVKLIGFADKDVEQAFALPMNDLEDNIQYILGSKLKCYYYVTNNVKDFNFNSVSTILPKNVRTIGND